MSQELSDQEKEQVREGITAKYAKVSISPTGCFRYPTGREGLRLQEYPADLIRDFPAPVQDSFCGVGNPFALGPIHAGEAVLDIGCGAGFDALVAAHLVGPQGRVVGIDVSEDMIEKARENLAALPELKNVAFQEGEAESLPFPDQYFDVILSNGVFNLTVDKRKALEEVYRVLKPGGRLMIADMALVETLPEDRAGKIENWYQ